MNNEFCLYAFYVHHVYLVCSYQNFIRMNCIILSERFLACNDIYNGVNKGFKDIITVMNLELMGMKYKFPSHVGILMP